MAPFPKKLINGYQNFMVNRFAFEKKRHEALAQHGQKPETMVIACCDSRATPENIFDTNPGEIFVLRNIANLVPPFDAACTPFGAASSAIEYAVLKLKVKHIVVLGHAHCGGIETALGEDHDPLSYSDFTGRWMRLINALADQISSDVNLTMAQKQTKLEQESIRTSIKNLRSFPWIFDKEQEGELSLYGAWFGIASGELWVLDEESDQFYKISYNNEEPFCNLPNYQS